MKVTRIAYSDRLNPGKYAALVEQARRLGRVRSEVWQRYGSVAGVGSGLTDRQVRDRWLADGTHLRFGVLANAWKETVRDATADIAANLASAKVEVRRAITRRTNILQRAGDPDIALHTSHHVVRQILRDRTDRHRTRLPVQDSSPATAERRANHPNRSTTSNQ